MNQVSQELADALRSALLDVFPVWLSLEPTDLRTFVRHAFDGAGHSGIETFRGEEAERVFLRSIAERREVIGANRLVDEQLPNLFGHLVTTGSGSSGQIAENVEDLLVRWCRILEQSPDPSDAADQIVNSLSRMIVEEQGTYEELAVLKGAVLEPGLDDLPIGDMATIRRLSDDEISAVLSKDSMSRASTLHGNHTCALSITRRVSARLTLETSKEGRDEQMIYEIRELRGRLERAIHLLRPGAVAFPLVRLLFHPAIFPVNGLTLFEDRRVAAPMIVLRMDDGARIAAYANGLKKTFPELQVAISRLHDAEHRSRDIDALIDAVIGLEALLNPQENTELGFRVALNYALLGPVSGRRERYDRLREIQKLRNRIVHSGSGGDRTKLGAGAKQAKECLREVIGYFLQKPRTPQNLLSADYWLNRLFAEQ